MKPLLTLFWQICLLRRGPEAMPVAAGLLGFVVVANLAISLVLALSLPEALVADPAIDLTPVSSMSILTSLLVSQSTFAGLLWFATRVRDCVARFPATVTAYFGCDLIVTLVILVVVQFTALVGVDVIRGILLITVIWSLAIAGFIIQRALSTSTAVGLGVAFAIMIVSFAVGEVATGS